MKKIISFFIVFLSFFLFNPIVMADELTVKSNNVILYDITDDTVLYEKNADDEVYIASLTKMMTLLVAVENINNFDEKIVVTSDMLKDVTDDLSVAGFEVGDTLTYNEMLYGIILKSGADATEIVAHSISGSEEEYVKLMNEKAKEIGMNNTNFTNVIGIEKDDHHSTARDLMKLVRYAIKNETFMKYFGTKTYNNMNGPLKTITNSDGYNMTYVKGAKTGYTSLAGLCLASYAEFNDTEFILITIGAPHENYNEHFVDTKNIYEYYLNNYDYVNIIDKGDKLVTLKDKYGKEYTIKANKNIKLYLNKSITKDDLKYTYKGTKTLKKGTKKKDKVGTIYVSYNGENIYTYSVTSPSDIKFDLKFFIINHKPQCLLVTLVITLIILFINLKRIKIKR